MDLLKLLPEGFQKVPSLNAVGRIIRPTGTFPLYAMDCPAVEDNKRDCYAGFLVNPIVSQRVGCVYCAGNNPYYILYVKCFIKQNGKIVKFGGSLDKVLNYHASEKDFSEQLAIMVSDERIFSHLDITCNKCTDGYYQLSRELFVPCNRCSGRGWQSVSDQWKNAYYDRDVRRKLKTYNEYLPPEHWFPDDRIKFLTNRRKKCLDKRKHN